MIVRIALCMVLVGFAVPGQAQTTLPLPDAVAPPPPAERTSYTVPDTGIDLSLIAPPSTQPGERMTIAPAIHEAPELTLEIPVP